MKYLHHLRAGACTIQTWFPGQAKGGVPVLGFRILDPFNKVVFVGEHIPDNPWLLDKEFVVREILAREDVHNALKDNDHCKHVLQWHNESEAYGEVHPFQHVYEPDANASGYWWSFECQACDNVFDVRVPKGVSLTSAVCPMCQCSVESRGTWAADCCDYGSRGPGHCLCPACRSTHVSTGAFLPATTPRR